MRKNVLFHSFTLVVYITGPAEK